MSALAALGGLQDLAQLTLDFQYCSQLSDVSALAALGGLQNLAQLTLNFGGHPVFGSGCPLSDVSALGWAASQKLEPKLNFKGCSQLSDATVREQLEVVVHLHPDSVILPEREDEREDDWSDY